MQVKESDLRDNEWLQLYAEVVMFSKWETDLVSEEKKTIKHRECLYLSFNNVCIFFFFLAERLFAGEDEESSGTNKGRCRDE